MDLNTVATKIKKWWKKYSSFITLNKILKHLQIYMTDDFLQELSNLLFSITCHLKNKDGSGLTGGIYIEEILCEYFKKIPRFEKFNNKECDLKICDVEFSLKKINGKTSIALDWSKNKENDLNDLSVRKNFESHIIIINLKDGKWWTKIPKCGIKNGIKNIVYNDHIYSGIYIIDKKYCQKNISLCKNNKTDKLISDKYLYQMIQRSMQQNLYIKLPENNKQYKFNILKAFSK